jgi:prepilin-type N-terminal cleavage/methylation domain-containing protein
MTSRSTDRGFTLVEMVAVVGVMGLILLAAVPSMSRYLEASRLAGAASRLAADLHFARSLANSEHATYELRRSTTDYEVVRLSPAATVLRRTMPRGITFEAADTTTFFAWGLTEAATFTLRARDRSRLVLLASSGQVTRD